MWNGNGQSTPIVQVKDVTKHFPVGDGEVTIILNDYGKPFDPDKIPRPAINVPLENLKPRGVGFYLMSKMMDEIKYTSNKKDGNTLTMVKRK